MTVIGMESMIVARGRGYQDDTTFDGFDVIAEPLAIRETRVFPGRDGPGVTYESHSVKLAKRADGYRSRDLFILLEHGGGRRVVRFVPCYDHGATEAALCALPEAVLYSILYAVATGVEQADRVARAEVRDEWAQAYCDGRIRKSRPKQGRRTVTIEPPAVAVPESYAADPVLTRCFEAGSARERLAYL